MFERIMMSLQRDAHLPTAERLRKGVRSVVATIAAPYNLRGVDVVGTGTRTINAPHVQNFGHMSIGARSVLTSTFAPIELSTGRGAALSIGDAAAVDFGVKISARQSIEIGARVSFGPYTMVADHDGDNDDEPRPIRIGSDVWLATRVTVRKGATIGDRAVITAGSVVEGDIPPGVIAGGVPARVLGYRDGTAPPPAPTASDAEDIPAEKSVDSPSPPPPSLEVRGTVVADFSVQELADHLRGLDDLGTSVLVKVAPFGQVVQTLHALASDSKRAGEFVFVWTRPEAIASFAALLEGKSVTMDAIEAEVTAFADHILEAARAMRFVFVATWTMPPHQRGFGLRDMKAGGASSALMRMNIRLADALSGASNVHVLDAAKWVSRVGAGAVSPRLWYIGKVGFTSGVLDEAARDIKAALRGVRGLAKKLVVVDLDDTLWGGIVGDVGWQGLRLGGHDDVGEAHVEFQRELKGLSRRGIALAIVSKNEESVALEAITSHPEMVLKLDDIVTHRINWTDKARNVADIAAELNLGLQSVVFIDDNPMERARVREALPEVYVPEWPKDPRLYVSTLSSLRCFDTPSLTKEDAERTTQYVAERKREELKASVGSLDDWLLSLGIRVQFAPLGPDNIVRATQLLNKTNQMNLSTRRLNEVELSGWASSPSHELWTISVGDKLGDAGLTGLLGIAFEHGVARIVDYVLSCRVMGRKVEETIVAFAIERAHAREAEEVVATYLQTPKNKPCLGFWKSSGFEFDEAQSTFRWRVRAPYAFPKCTTVEVLDAGRAVEAPHAV